MKSIEQLLKEYEPHNYELIVKPLENESIEEYKGIGCKGTYSNIKYGICPDYWYNVIKADERYDD